MLNIELQSGMIGMKKVSNIIKHSNIDKNDEEQGNEVDIQNGMSYAVTLSDDSESQSSHHDMTNDSAEESKLHDTQNGNFILFKA